MCVNTTLRRVKKLGAREWDVGGHMAMATVLNSGTQSQMGTDTCYQTLLLTRGAESPTGWSRRNRPPFEAQSEVDLSTRRLPSWSSPPPPWRRML